MSPATIAPRGHGRESADQRGVAGLTPDLASHPADLPIDIGAHSVHQRSEHQPRPRDIIPMTTPTTSAPASVPSGLRLAMPSSSDAKVLACSLAEVARSELMSATPLAALPTCEASVWLAPRTVFVASSPA